MLDLLLKGLVGTVTLVAVGQGLDLLIPRRLKGRLHEQFTSYWIRLDDTTIPELPASLAKHALRSVHQVVGPRLLSPRALRRYVAASLVLTLATVVVGLLLSDVLSGVVHNFLQSSKDSVKPDTAEMLQTAIVTLEKFNSISFIAKHPRWFAYLAFWNAVFDLASIACTVSFLVGIVRYRAHPIVFLLLDLIVAVACALGSFVCAVYLAVETTSAEGELGVSGAQRILSFAVATVTAIPYSVSTLLPTAGFLIAMLLALSGKGVLAGSRALGLSLLERVTDDPAESSKPATIMLSAVWLAAIAATSAWTVFWAVYSYLGALVARIP